MFENRAFEHTQSYGSTTSTHTNKFSNSTIWRFSPSLIKAIYHCVLELIKIGQYLSAFQKNIMISNLLEYSWFL